jgi:copper(I)-binding protein
MTTPVRRSRTVRVLAPLAAFATFGALAACGGDDETTDGASGDAVTVADAWARTSAMSQTNGATYFVITGGAEDDALVGALAPTDIAATTEVHETVMSEDAMSQDTMAMSEATMGMSDDTMMGEDEMSDDTMMGEDDGHSDMGGTMTMQEVARVEVPAGETVAFEPGGYHVMLFDLAEPLVAGETFEMELTFENAGTVTVEVEVRDE